jgi:hypothetical protein
MISFDFYCPTRIIFGKNKESRIGGEAAKYGKKILLHYGGGSIKKIGLYDKITASLKEQGIEFVELGGVKPNPRLSLVQDGIELCRKEGIDFILAVGGGSVIDSAKAIAVGVPYQGNVWDFYEDKAKIKEALPLGVVLTIPAAGSESSPASVITNEDGDLKRAIASELVISKFSILNPETAMNLPQEQMAYGVTDILSHLMERYFTNVDHVELTDRLLEATMKTVINNGLRLVDDYGDYDAWAEIMWSGTVAHNNILNTGRIGCWGSHAIEHELSGIYDVAHGAGLAVVFPAWMQYVYKHDINRFAQFASRVWNVDMNYFNPEETALEGIARLRQFFESLGLATKLEGIGIDDSRLEEMSQKCAGEGTVGQFVKLKAEDVLNIYRIAL